MVPRHVIEMQKREERKMYQEHFNKKNSSLPPAMSTLPNDLKLPVSFLEANSRSIFELKSKLADKESEDQEPNLNG